MTESYSTWWKHGIANNKNIRCNEYKKSSLWRFENQFSLRSNSWEPSNLFKTWNFSLKNHRHMCCSKGKGQQNWDYKQLESLVCSALVLLFALFILAIIAIFFDTCRNMGHLRWKCFMTLPFLLFIWRRNALLFGHFSYFLDSSIFSHQETNERMFQRNHKSHQQY